MYTSMIIQLYYILILELIYNYFVITTVCKEFSPLGTQQYREIKSLGIHKKSLIKLPVTFHIEILVLNLHLCHLREKIASDNPEIIT